MKLQLALDRLTREACFHIIDETIASIDIIEIGTGIIKEYGMAIIKETKEKYAELPLLADMKTCDAGESEAEQAFSSGADIMTVMGFSENQTILDALSVSKKYEKRIMIDLLGIKSSERVKELVGLGCDLFCLHIGKDTQQHGELTFDNMLHLIENLKGIEVAIAGGIDANMAKELNSLPVDIIIVGSGITSSRSPRLASREIANYLLH